MISLIKMTVVCVALLSLGAVAHGTDFLWLTNPERPNIYAYGFSLNASEAWVVNQVNGTNHLLRTLDGGRTWAELSAKPVREFWQPRVYCSPARTYFLMDQESTWTSADAETWTPLKSSDDKSALLSFSQNALSALRTVNPLELPLPIVDSSIVLSTSLGSNEISALFEISSESIIAVQTSYSETEWKQSKAFIMQMIKTAGSWKRVSLFELSKKLPITLNYLYCLDSKRLWSSSDQYGLLYCSKTGGKEWEEVDFPDRPVSLCFFNGRGFGRVFASSLGQVFDTHDNGKSWSKISDDYMLNPQFLEDLGPTRPSVVSDFSVIQMLTRSKGQSGKRRVR